MIQPKNILQKALRCDTVRTKAPEIPSDFPIFRKTARDGVPGSCGVPDGLRKARQQVIFFR